MRVVQVHSNTNRRTKMSNSLALRRRTFLNFGLLGAAVSAALPVKAFAQAPANVSFIAPTADNPIRINFNENALGMSPSAQAAARDAVAKGNRYAKAEITQLHTKLCDMYNVPKNFLLLTDGSSEGIRALLGAYSRLKKVQLVIPELTYGDGEHFANLYNVPVVKVPMLADWKVDVAGLKKAVDGFDGFSIVYFVNPNNPTSTVTPASEIELWVKSKPDNTLFIADEAYAEYVSDPNFKSMANLIQDGLDNVVLLKTFSKLYAMAGMRVGFAVGAPAIIKMMKDQVAGEKLNYPGVTAALVSLDDEPFQEYSRASNLESRKILASCFDKLGVKYLPSSTNFMFFELNEPIHAFQKKMAARNILVGRPFPPAMTWCRISLGTLQEMAYVANELTKMRAEGVF